MAASLIPPANLSLVHNGFSQSFISIHGFADSLPLPGHLPDRSDISVNSTMLSQDFSASLTGLIELAGFVIARYGAILKHIGEDALRAFSALTTSELVVIFVLSFFLRCLIAWYEADLRRRRFNAWAKSQGCAQCSSLPRPFMASIRHKIRLLAAKSGDLLDTVFAEKYRTYGATHALHDSFGIPRVIHTIDPVNLNALTSSSFSDWKPSKSRTNTLYPLAQEGLLTTDGSVWHHNRKMIQRFIGTNNAKEIKDAEKDIQLLFTAIGPVDQSGWTDVVDLLELFHRMALDMSTTYLLGTSAESQAKGLYEKEKQAAKVKYNLVDAKVKKQKYTYDEAYEIVRDYFSWRSKLGSKYWLADGLDYRAACAAINDFADDLVAKAIEQSKSAVEPKRSFGLIDRLVTEIGEPIAIRNLIMDLFIAGQNMTGTMAAWVFARLSAHPEVYQQARQEIVNMFGTESSPKALMTWNNLRTCNLLQWCILETIRMYPLLANIGRNARNDTILPRGGGPDGTSPVAVPAGAAITANLYLMHRRPEEWGEDAWEWKPHRWQGRKFGAEYAPFGAGPRICIGQQLTMTEISLLTARMLQRFSAMAVPEGQDNLTKNYRVSISPKYGVKVKLQKSRL